MHCRDLIKLDTFRFRDKFEDLDDFRLGLAIETVNAEFSGVYHLWAWSQPDERKAKIELCMSYLVAWALVNMWPDSLSDDGMAGTGGMPLTMKKAGPVMVKYKDMTRESGTLLDSLQTNVFGIQALLMIQSAPETYMVYGGASGRIR